MDNYTGLEEFRTRLTKIARASVGADNAYDVVQDAFLLYLSEGGTEAGIEADLLKCLSRACNAHTLASRREGSMVRGLPDIEAADDARDDLTLSRQAQERLLSARLTCIECEVVRLTLEGKFQAEIAALTGVGQSSVSRAWTRAKKRLEACAVTLDEFRSPQEMFSYCAHQYVYFAPPSTGQGLWNAKLKTIK